MTVSDERLMELIAAIEAEWGVDMPDEGEWIADEIAALRELQAARKVLAKPPKPADGVAVKAYIEYVDLWFIDTDGELVKYRAWDVQDRASVDFTRAGAYAAMAEEKNDD